MIEADKLSMKFCVGTGLLSPKRNLWAVLDVSMKIESGQTVGLVGESGCGKSTVGQIILARQKPTSGTVFFKGQELHKFSPGEMRRLRRHMQMVFQDPYGSLNPRLRIGDTIQEGLDIHRPEIPVSGRKERVRDLLRRVGLQPEHADRYPSQFSGGQRQRIAIARALAPEPSFIVADEPVSALDVSVQAQIINLLMDIKREKELSMLFISHDLKVVRHVSDHVAVMYLGRLVELAPTENLFASPLHPYTKALLSAIPQAGARNGREKILLGGEVPSPLSPPPGCVFHPRCPSFAGLTEKERSRCCHEVPGFLRIEAGPGRSVACHYATL